MSCIFAGVALTTIIYAVEPTPQGRQAAQYSSQATYYQCGIKEQIEPTIKNLEKKYVPEVLQKFGIGATVIYRAVKDNKLEFTWSF